MVDANQAWDLDSAIAMGRRLAELAPGWIEEPLRADRPWQEWQRLAAACEIPLAAGENMIGVDAFDALIASRAVAVVQPDLAKWGGVSGVLDVIGRIDAAGLRHCPHYLGAGIGLLASAHVLAANAREGGLLEVDANENPLRTLLCPPLGELARRAHHARRGTRARHRARHRRVARDVRAREHLRVARAPSPRPRDAAQRGSGGNVRR